MPGEPDVYAAARRILLDALEALDQHLDAVVLVGAQAIYLHTGNAEVAVAPFTRDADMVLNPAALGSDPPIEAAMNSRGFSQTSEPGRWIKDEIPVDLMVPETLAGPGRRGADLGPHGRTVARRARGLESALVDKSVLEIRSLDPTDTRMFRMAVAGPAALLIAKVHKLAERVGNPGRHRDKDAPDVLRLLRTTDSKTLAQRLNSLMSDNLAAATAKQAVSLLRDLFGARNGRGALAAGRALEGLENSDTVTGSCEALVEELNRAGLDL